MPDFCCFTLQSGFLWVIVDVVIRKSGSIEGGVKR